MRNLLVLVVHYVVQQIRDKSKYVDVEVKYTMYDKQAKSKYSTIMHIVFHVTFSDADNNKDSISSCISDSN